MDESLSLTFTDETLAEKVGHCLVNFRHHTLWSFGPVNPIKISPRVCHVEPQVVKGSLHTTSSTTRYTEYEIWIQRTYVMVLVAGYFLQKGTLRVGRRLHYGTSMNILQGTRERVRVVDEHNEGIVYVLVSSCQSRLYTWMLIVTVWCKQGLMCSV